MRDQLISAGVKQLRDFGYPSCDESNILTSPVLGAFFVSMLEGTKGKHERVDIEIDGLIKEIKSNIEGAL